MDIEHPQYLYKYRAVSGAQELSQDHSIDTLFKCQAIFSTRKNFNDLFDSKIEFIRPTPKQIQSLGNKAEEGGQFNFRKLVSDGQFTERGHNFIKNSEEGLGTLIDSYLFFCVSKNCKSNLMWSHYADSHKGFCIEFKSEHIRADKVAYQDEIPRIEVMDFLINQVNLSNNIWQSLRTKLKEWEYEDEYRFQPSKSMVMTDLPGSNGLQSSSYDPKFIESIIFGCRTPASVKEYITKNIPYRVKFKQAVERTSSIEIIDLA